MNTESILATVAIAFGSAVSAPACYEATWSSTPRCVPTRAEIEWVSWPTSRRGRTGKSSIQAPTRAPSPSRPWPASPPMPSLRRPQAPAPAPTRPFGHRSGLSSDWEETWGG